MNLLDNIKVEIKNHALEFPQEEVCGVIVKGDKAIRLKNYSFNKAETFLIHPDEVQKVGENEEILGFYHSHLEKGGFHEADKAVSERNKLPSVIYNLKSDSFEVYEPCGYEIPYLNRPYLLSVLDCFTLVIDYYKREFNVNIPHLIHPIFFDLEEWKQSPLNKPETTDFIEHFKKNGFKVVQELQKNDVIIMSYGRIKCPIHAAIYLGNNCILHHPPFGFSKSEIYQENLKKRTLAKLRYER